MKTREWCPVFYGTRIRVRVSSRGKARCGVAKRGIELHVSSINDRVVGEGNGRVPFGGLGHVRLLRVVRLVFPPGKDPGCSPVGGKRER